jgi:hypothetical protein
VAKFSANDFKKSWHGWGVNSAMWDLGQSGNYHKFTSADGAKMPKGEYILQINDEWYDNKMNLSANADLKKQTIRLASPVKVGIDVMTEDQAIRVLSMGKAKMKNKGMACPAYNSAALGTGKTLSELVDLAVAAGQTEFMFSQTQGHWNAYYCKAGTYTPSAGWSGHMNIFEVMTPA